MISAPFWKHFKLLEKYLTKDNIAYIESKWREPHRVYHDLEHLSNILELIERAKDQKSLTDEQFEDLVLIAFFHDVIYDTHGKNNEEQSAELFRQMCGGTIDPARFKTIYSAIMDTEYKGDFYAMASSPESQMFMQFDLDGLVNGNLSRMITDEKKVFKEFGFVDFATYKEVRLNILKGLEEKLNQMNPRTKVRSYIEWFENTNAPRIAVYPGSFNPMHRGHRDILARAEKMFDKVIVLIGRNPAKPDDSLDARAEKIRHSLPNNQVEIFDGMLHSHCKSLPYPVTIIKGLRNEDDFKNEKMQLRFMEDYDPEISVCYIIGDRANEHVSSSAIRQINTFGPDTTQYR